METVCGGGRKVAVWAVCGRRWGRRCGSSTPPPTPPSMYPCIRSPKKHRNTHRQTNWLQCWPNEPICYCPLPLRHFLHPIVHDWTLTYTFLELLEVIVLYGLVLQTFTYTFITHGSDCILWISSANTKISRKEAQTTQIQTCIIHNSVSQHFSLPIVGYS